MGTLLKSASLDNASSRQEHVGSRRKTICLTFAIWHDGFNPTMNAGAAKDYTYFSVTGADIIAEEILHRITNNPIKSIRLMLKTIVLIFYFTINIYFTIF